MHCLGCVLSHSSSRLFQLSHYYTCGKYLSVGYVNTQSKSIDHDNSSVWIKAKREHFRTVCAQIFPPPTCGYFSLCQVIKNIEGYISHLSDLWPLCTAAWIPPSLLSLTRPAVAQQTPLSPAICNCYVRHKTSEITIYQASWFLPCTQFTPLCPNQGFIGVERR